jgi:hypothetical protein
LGFVSEFLFGITAFKLAKILLQSGFSLLEAGFWRSEAGFWLVKGRLGGGKAALDIVGRGSRLAFAPLPLQ